MGSVDTEQFTEYMLETFGDRLRSVTYYEWDDFEVVYSREGVLEEYDPEDVQRIAKDLQMESLGKPVAESRFAHGDLLCRISCFDNGTAINFLLEDGEGIAVGLEAGSLVTESAFIGNCFEMMELTPRELD